MTRHEDTPTRRASLRALALPAACAMALGAFLLWPPLRANAVLARSFAGAALLILAWTASLYLSARGEGRSLSIDVVLRKPHYVQMFAQGAVLVYWGWWVRSVYAYAPFILAQILFAYAFDALLNWTRRDTYRLGAGPIPVIFSISLFLWFRLEYFHWQLAMVALVFVGKEFIRWTRDGRSAHIFNPSSFALAVTSLLLIVTASTDKTLGIEIAQTQYNPPHIFTAIFLASIPGQLLFGVATMTVAAVVSAYLFGLVYYQITGIYFFYDAYIPIAVFLGMHLLVTDPATSPRSEQGRVVFGTVYGLLVIAFAAGLDAIGVPNFYDKLLPVPIVNLLVRRIDRWAERVRLPAPAWVRALDPPRYRAAVVGLWVVVFASLVGVNALGDHHPGQYLPFWENACEKGSERGCGHLMAMQQNYCGRGSGWACNELGVTRMELARDRSTAERAFQQACRLQFEPGCENARRLASPTGSWERASPPLAELPIVLRGSKGPVTERSPEDLYALACRTGWPGTCDGPPGVLESPADQP